MGQAQAATPNHSETNPGLIILQWLTYAFWGWTVLAMSFLVALVISHFVNQTSGDEGSAYVVAAVLVLLPISLVCDYFYAKHEPVKKAGIASAIMIIHAVIFALFCIGAVIAIVFSIVSMAISSSDSQSTEVALFSALVISFLYAATFLRTLNPSRLFNLSKRFSAFMLIVVGIIAILAIAGPIMGARATRNDRLIEGSLSSLSNDIEDYANKNDQLPTSLSVLDLNGDEQKLTDSNLVTYQANTRQPQASSSRYGSNSSLYSSSRNQSNRTFYYQLCATYSKASDHDAFYARSSYDDVDSDGYSTSLTAYYHDAGEVCYKLKTDSF